MKTKALVEVLSSREGCTHKDGTIEIDEQTEVSLYTSMGSETLMVSALSSIVIADELLIAHNRKGELTALVAEDVRAVRVGKSSGKRRTGLI